MASGGYIWTDSCQYMDVFLDSYGQIPVNVWTDSCQYMDGFLSFMDRFLSSKNLPFMDSKW